MLPAPAPGFDEPLAMLRACHERIQRQCATLAKLAAHLRSDGLTDGARQAAVDIHRYFSSAGRQHHADDETMDEVVEPLLAAPDTIHDLDAFAQLAGEFNALYRQHIARENNELLPLAEQLLSVEQQRELGARMAARSGVSL